MNKIDVKVVGTQVKRLGTRLGKALQGVGKVAEKAAKAAAFRREASRKAAIANKRIKRLEANDLTDSPAYQNYIKGKGNFSIKGKTYNEVQREVARLDRFIDSQTSTIRGVNKNLKEIAANTGIKYRNLTDLRAKASKFFEVSSKVEQLLRTMDDMASAIGYQKIWEAVNTYVKDKRMDLSDTEMDIDMVAEYVSKAIAELESPTNIPYVGKYRLKDSDFYKI